MVKRAVDITAGTLLAVLLLPVMLVLALATALLFRSWPLFVHERVGRDGRLIRFPKLRSMPRVAPRYATYDKLTVTLPRFATFLRRTHLDELPQLFLVATGRLSLVGPRPAMPEEYEPIDTGFRDMRLSVPPGCTCLWQIGLHTEGLPSQAPEYDEFYVRHTSVRLDALILWWTALRMLGVGSARSLDDVPRWARRASTAPRYAPSWPRPDARRAAAPLAMSSQAATTDLSDGITTPQQ